MATHGAVLPLLAAYAGLPADDVPGRPSSALSGYLRWAVISDPALAAIAAAQLRQLAGRLLNEPDTVPSVIHDALPVTPAGEKAGASWADTVATLLEQAVDSGFPPPGPPVTFWEWNQRFPALAQFLGCYFTQDFRDEFADHDTATAAWGQTATPADRARLIGEIAELLALEMADNELDEALATLGMDVDPPLPASAWLSHVHRSVTGSDR
ncbi:hypothetical protein DZF91_07655 [Actinomadura logoneensis]|uniref:CdiI immunity protein domain-containing protein n=2 Tax=Actinomadura logoneensis TaxID=2293572 RepID=A0A372JQ97_9ACTN|nr:hypothetical protein DZF91_07655 [Actinomadura logoneensis]